MTSCPCCGCEMMLQCDGTPQHVGRKCYEGDLTFCLDRQVKELRKKVESLINAGDALADCIRYDSPRYEIEIINRWDEAKDS